MKIKILTALFSLLAVVSFSSCIGDDDTGVNGGNSTLPTVKIYELDVNNTKWSIYASKITLTDNAEKNSETYEYDYTLTVRAMDASNMINADSKTLNINFNADDLAALKNENIAEGEEFHLLYRGKMETKPTRYNTTDGIMTITEIDDKGMTIVFNNLSMKAERSSSMLPGTEPPTLKIHGSIKCSL